MSSAIVVHPNFDAVWPWTGDHMHRLWAAQGPVEFVRLPYGEAPAAHTAVKNPGAVTRLVSFGLPFTAESLKAMPKLKELHAGFKRDDPLAAAIKEAGIALIGQKSEGYWGQSVSEFGFALTLCALRRIPQTHHSIVTDLAEWNYNPAGGKAVPGRRGQQFGDDPAFANGTLEGKRVRIVGAGNIASRYASFCHFFGADVAAWDPFASEPCFHRAGARREHFLDRLVKDAEIFVPMVPLTDATRNLVKAEQIDALPKGCLVVMVTRARICDCEALYKRVLNDELSLAADVFDEEPVPLGHPFLGRPNVVHTPHNAGRTKEANFRYAELLAEQFKSV
ncbi:MAG: hydroxyacid dehydrogenase [Planctomycetota bacterium]|nr:hydroxyacid dehydrogenase [Planctomycetota bacterium]